MIVQNALFDFYHDIIPDPDAFIEYAARPLPQTYRLNTLRCRDNVFAENVSQPMTWNDYAYRYNGADSLGLSWQYKIGLIQVQEEVSMLPVALLDPKPQEKIIDLCAAPGNKTAEIGLAMRNTGTLIANDRNYQRMKALGQIVRRMGLCNITLTVQDALNYQSFPEYFDKVLVDAPCSCEGTFRKRPKKMIQPNAKNHRRLAASQIAIMKKAIQLCKPGGRIVYSTCTFAPEENEGVVTAILNKFSDQVRIKPIVLPGWTWSNGLSGWQGESFHPDVAHTMRVWPHQNDSGGFYVAVFEKYASDGSACHVAEAPLENKGDLDFYLQELQQRYQFSDDLLTQFALQQASNRGIYMINKQHALPTALSKDSSGLIFMKTRTRFPKLSTGAAMILGQHAKRNVVRLSETQFQHYLKREECVLSTEQVQGCSETGFVIVMFAGHIAGLGLYLSAHHDKPPRLQSLFPKEN